MADPAIEITGLRKSYGRTDVLTGIDLQVDRGTVFGYIGPNGAGKTTTVKILIGVLSDFEGSAKVSGVDVRSDPRMVKRRIGYVPENAVLYEGLTCFEFLQLAGRLHDLDDRRIKRRASVLLSTFDLEEWAHSRIGSLSKGMRQKVLISSALLHDPPVLFLDEPLSGLDVASTVLIKDLISALAKQGRTIFYCSHMMDVVERVCDRIAILSGGQVVADGSFEELAAAHSSDESLESVFRNLTGTGKTDQRLRDLLQELDGGEA